MPRIDLADPKQTRIEGNDLSKIQATALVTTAGGVDFDVLGVAKDDVLRILEGPDAGDYTLASDPLAPSFVTLELVQSMSFTDTPERRSWQAATSAPSV